MKTFKIFLIILILAAASTAAVNIFFDNVPTVSVVKIEKQSFEESLKFSGTLDDSEYMKVTTMVGEANISRISLGQKAEITGNGFKGKTYYATVAKIGDTAKKVSVGNAKTVAVEVCLAVDNPDDALKSGFTAKVKIFTDNKSNVITAPYSSVLQDESGEYVYVYDGEKAVRTAVKTGRELASGYEILSGLRTGDLVITYAKDIKKNNSAVNVNLKGAQ